jgi:predicted RND superfamily exporter protein
LFQQFLGFGVWGLFVGSMGMSLAVVTGMTLGIVVDDTVHFLTKYLLARREQAATAADAVRYAFKTVAPAMLGYHSDLNHWIFHSEFLCISIE